MELEIAVAEGEAVVAVSGRVDVLSADALAGQIQRHVDVEEPKVVVDLHAVDYIDSAGLAVLVRFWRQQTDEGRQFLVRLPEAEAARRVFSLTGFDLVFETA